MSAAALPESGAGPLVRDLVRDVVAEVAVEELPVVDGLAALDYDVVVKRLAGGSRGRKEPLGFGWESIVVLVTPVVWLVVDEAAKRAAGAVVDAGVKGTKALWRKALRRGSGEVVVPALTDDQRAEVRKRLLEAAERHGMDADRAADLTESVMRRLDAAGHPGDADDTPGRQ
ncbi:hypothetical protein AB0425_41010 [Actinosynnema sp. NPDC051121]